MLKLGDEYIGVHFTILCTLYRFEVFHNKKKKFKYQMPTMVQNFPAIWAHKFYFCQNQLEVDFLLLIVKNISSNTLEIVVVIFFLILSFLRDNKPSSWILSKFSRWKPVRH